MTMMLKAPAGDPLGVENNRLGAPATRVDDTAVLEDQMRYVTRVILATAQRHYILF